MNESTEKKPLSPNTQNRNLVFSAGFFCVGGGHLVSYTKKDVALNEAQSC